MRRTELLKPAVHFGFGSAITRSVGSPIGCPFDARNKAPAGALPQAASMSVGTPLITIVSPRPQRAKSDPRMTPTGYPTVDVPSEPVKPSLLYGTNSAPSRSSTLFLFLPKFAPTSQAKLSPVYGRVLSVTSRPRFEIVAPLASAVIEPVCDALT